MPDADPLAPPDPDWVDPGDPPPTPPTPPERIPNGRMDRFSPNRSFEKGAPDLRRLLMAVNTMEGFLGDFCDTRPNHPVCLAFAAFKTALRTAVQNLLQGVEEPEEDVRRPGLSAGE